MSSVTPSVPPSPGPPIPSPAPAPSAAPKVASPSRLPVFSRLALPSSRPRSVSADSVSSVPPRPASASVRPPVSSRIPPPQSTARIPGPQTARSPAPSSARSVRPSTAAPSSSSSSVSKPVGKFAVRAAILQEKADKMIKDGVPFDQVYRQKTEKPSSTPAARPPVRSPARVKGVSSVASKAAPPRANAKIANSPEKSSIQRPNTRTPAAAAATALRSSRPTSVVSSPVVSASSAPAPNSLSLLAASLTPTESPSLTGASGSDVDLEEIHAPEPPGLAEVVRPVLGNSIAVRPESHSEPLIAGRSRSISQPAAAVQATEASRTARSGSLSESVGSSTASHFQASKPPLLVRVGSRGFGLGSGIAAKISALSESASNSGKNTPGARSRSGSQDLSFGVGSGELRLPTEASLPFPSADPNQRSAAELDAMRLQWATEKLRADCGELLDWLQRITGGSRSEVSDHSVADALFDSLQTGCLLCLFATACESSLSLKFHRSAVPGSFQARDNIALFLRACEGWGIKRAQLFETDDLVLRKNDRAVANALLDVARCVWIKFGIEPPDLIKFEFEIDELEKNRSEPSEPIEIPPINAKPVESESHTLVYLPRWLPYVPVAGDPLDEAVAKVLNTNSLDVFVKRLCQGQYYIGDPKLNYLRLVRSLVLVRVGGGFEPLMQVCMRKMGFDDQLAVTITNKGKGSASGSRTPVNR